jgi:hypothetical protein
VSGEHRHDRRLVHEFEVGDVDTVFHYVLRVQLPVRLVQGLAGVVIGQTAAVLEAGEDVGHIEERLTAFDVMPDVGRLVAFHHGVGTHLASAVGSLLVGDTDVATLVVPLPAVKGAFDDLAFDVAAETQVSAEVFAVGVHHRQPARLRTPGDHFAAEVVHRVYVAGGDLVGPRDLEPTGRLHRQRRFRHLSSF